MIVKFTSYKHRWVYSQIIVDRDLEQLLITGENMPEVQNIKPAWSAQAKKVYRRRFGFLRNVLEREPQPDPLILFLVLPYNLPEREFAQLQNRIGRLLLAGCLPQLERARKQSTNGYIHLWSFWYQGKLICQIDLLPGEQHSLDNQISYREYRSEDELIALTLSSSEYLFFPPSNTKNYMNEIHEELAHGLKSTVDRLNKLLKEAEDSGLKVNITDTRSRNGKQEYVYELSILKEIKCS